MSNCNCHDEISRDGSAQLSRYLKALDPANAPIDDRSIEELLIFTKRYANQVRFYDLPKPGMQPDPKTSWKEFFRRDIAVIAASITTFELDKLKTEYNSSREKVEIRPNHHSFGNLFDPIVGMIIKIDRWYSLATPDNPLHEDLQLAIDSNLKEQLLKLIAYEDWYKQVDSKNPLNIDYSAIENKSLWGLPGMSVIDNSVYDKIEVEEKIKYAALFIDEIFNSFYAFIAQLIKRSEGYMHYALENYPSHQPHMALFISFLKLFRLAQEQMNGITERMLDFYYRDVLHLSAKSSIPDKANIVFELAKDVAEYKIPPGTKFNAGKDASGKDLLYKTNKDLVINEAIVKELKTVFIEKDPIAKKIIQRIYARPIAKSKDGFGEKFTDTVHKWPTFGKGSAFLSGMRNPCNQVALLDEAGRKDQARVGFGLASPQLVLQGGKRLIKIDVDMSVFEPTDANDPNKGVKAIAKKDLEKALEALFLSLTEIEIWLTGKKGWVKAIPYTKLTGVDAPAFLTEAEGGIFPDDSNFQNFYFFSKTVDADNKSSYCMNVYLTLDEQSIVAFDPAIHPDYDLKTNYPAILIMNSNSSDINIDETIYKQLVIPNLRIRTKVGSVNHPITMTHDATGAEVPEGPLPKYHFDGLRILTLENKFGSIEADKPFDPFTPFPIPGSALYIGSDEIFNKPLEAKNGTDTLAMNIRKTMDEDGDLTNNTINFEKFKVAILKKKEWRQIIANDLGTFTHFDLTKNVLTGSGFLNKRAPIRIVKELNAETQKGFIKLNLNLQRNNIAFVGRDLNNNLEVAEISVSYDSTLKLEAGTDQFFHIYPFGVAETYLPGIPSFDFSSLDKLKDSLLIDAKSSLLPQFTFLSPYAKPDDTGSQVKDLPAAIQPVLGEIKKAILKPSVFEAMLKNNAAAKKIEGYSNQYSGSLQEEGMLFIGLEKLKPLQSISLLFQFAEGSAENEDAEPPKINWSYLTYNEWRPMKAENIVSDGTYGFQATGIVKIDVPEDANLNNTVITKGLIWFCASVSENSDRIPQLIDIVTQAIEVTFDDDNNDQSHFEKTLPAGSISKLDTPVAEVSKVLQPFASFDGKAKEVGKQFYTRVSERLRHKGRAITAWDYEHLVLDRFQSIYKVKCITHTDANCFCRKKHSTVKKDSKLPVRIFFNGPSIKQIDIINKLAATLISPEYSSTKITLVGYGAKGSKRIETVFNALAIDKSRMTLNIFQNSNPGSIDFVDIEETGTCCGPQVAPGHVLIIPIANLKDRNAANPLQPKTSRRTLIAIQEYLKTRTSPFVHVLARNPEYEQIIVSFKVKFHKGRDKGYYMKELNQEIVRFLTPWAFDEKAEVKFNQKIYASSIINHIEEMDYVDFITDFVMHVCCNECCPPPSIIAGTVITGTISDSNKDPIKAVSVIEKGTSNAFITLDDGKFSLTVKKTGPVVLSFSVAGNYQGKEVNIEGDINDLDITLYKFDEALSNISNCHDVEWLLKRDKNFNGDIVAVPCSSRSIMVSVPQHEIIPYEEDEEKCRCEKRSDDTKKLAGPERRIAAPVPKPKRPLKNPGAKKKPK